VALPGDLPQDPQLLPHTTGAITNDVVAFSEGWGIHFETLAGDRREDDRAYSMWHRDRFATTGDIISGDSFVPINDLMSYAQTYRRYACVKDNCFAYLPRTTLRASPTAADVVARWTDTTFDPANVRSLEQMVASEGVIATLFYRLATAPSPNGPSGIAGDPVLPDPARYAAMFEAFARVTEDKARTTPCVLVFLEALLERADRSERARIARIAMEVFHYTLVVRDAPAFYSELHAIGHHIDKAAFLKRVAARKDELQAAVRKLSDEPALLRTAAAPELWVTHARVLLDLPRLGIAKRPLVFDLNAAPIELLMTLPDVGYTEALAIDEVRRARGLRSVDDLATVRGIQTSTVQAVRTMQLH
jgi:DNA uptake protein ComE-like DNA-binding protein